MHEDIGQNPPDEAPQQDHNESTKAESNETRQFRVDLDRIITAPIPVPTSSGDAFAKKEQASLAHEQEQFKRELGLLGVPFGGRREKPGNISALVIVLIFYFLILSYIIDTIVHINYPYITQTGMSFEKLFAGLSSVITLILGYLFGSNDRSDK